MTDFSKLKRDDYEQRENSKPELLWYKPDDIVRDINNPLVFIIKERVYDISLHRMSHKDIIIDFSIIPNADNFFCQSILTLRRIGILSSEDIRQLLVNYNKYGSDNDNQIPSIRRLIILSRQADEAIRSIGSLFADGTVTGEIGVRWQLNTVDGLDRLAHFCRATGTDIVQILDALESLYMIPRIQIQAVASTITVTETELTDNAKDWDTIKKLSAIEQVIEMARQIEARKLTIANIMSPIDFLSLVRSDVTNLSYVISREILSALRFQAYQGFNLKVTGSKRRFSTFEGQSISMYTSLHDWESCTSLVTRDALSINLLNNYEIKLMSRAGNCPFLSDHWRMYDTNG